MSSYNVTYYKHKNRMKLWMQGFLHIGIVALGLYLAFGLGPFNFSYWILTKFNAYFLGKAIPLIVFIPLSMFIGGWFSREFAQVFLGHSAISVSDDLDRDGLNLKALVGECAKVAGIPSPDLMVLSSSKLNAFATGRDSENGLVVLSTALISSCKHNPEALKAIILHEMGHTWGYHLWLTMLISLPIKFLRLTLWIADLFVESMRLYILLDIAHVILDATFYGFRRLMEHEADFFAVTNGYAVQMIQALKIIHDPLAYKKVFKNNTVQSLVDLKIIALTPPVIVATSKGLRTRIWEWLDSWSNPNVPKESTHLLLRFIDGLVFHFARFLSELFSTHPHPLARIEAIEDYIRENQEKVALDMSDPRGVLYKVKGQNNDPAPPLVPAQEPVMPPVLPVEAPLFALAS